MILDAKDYKILRCLDIDARVSVSEIAKKTQLSKFVITSRLEKYKQDKIIKNYITYFDVEKFGYIFYDIFIKTSFIKPEEMDRIVDEISKIHSVGWFVKIRGEWSILVCIMAKSPKELAQIMNNIFQIVGEYMQRYKILIVTKAYQQPYKILLHEKEHEINSVNIGEEQTIEVDENDKKIMSFLSENARAPITEISSKTGLSIDLVRYRINQLKKNGIIQGFKPLLNIPKFNVLWHIVLLNLKYATKEQLKRINNFVKNRKEVFYVVWGVGSWQMMIETHTKTHDEFDLFYADLRKEFEEIISFDSSLLVSEEIKCHFLPDL
jgi:DNA-binding Lrp family transcriptional regulator